MTSFRRLVCLLGFLAASSGSWLAAQPVPADPLDQVLDNWERAMKDVTAFESQVVRKRTSVRFETTEICEGRARILKNSEGLLASLELSKKETPGQPVEKLLLTRNGLCEYDFAAKEVRVHPLTVKVDRADNPIAYLFGVNAKDMKNRFDLKLGAPDPNYFLIDILPRTKRSGTFLASTTRRIIYGQRTSRLRRCRAGR
jgi:TIGR03009 family protein